MGASPAARPPDEVALHRLRLRALACQREGRVRIYVVDRNWDADFREWRVSMRILAHVASSRPGRPPYEVRCVDGLWTCAPLGGVGTCADQETDGVCKHALAVAIVTGHSYAGNRPVHAEPE